jgi:hypothetical protein
MRLLSSSAPTICAGVRPTSTIEPSLGRKRVATEPAFAAVKV